MPNPYSYDFRQKVIEAIKLNGLKKSEASELFNISRNTIDLWLKRFAETGDFQARRPNSSGYRYSWWRGRLSHRMKELVLKAITTENFCQ